MRDGMRFESSDVVRIHHLSVPDRAVDGPSAEPPQPRVGDFAMVVTSLGDDLYLVERVTDDGRILWTAEFHASELTLIERESEQ